MVYGLGREHLSAAILSLEMVKKLELDEAAHITLLKITYKPENGSLTIIIAMVKGK